MHTLAGREEEERRRRIEEGGNHYDSKISFRGKDRREMREESEARGDEAADDWGCVCDASPPIGIDNHHLASLNA